MEMVIGFMVVKETVEKSQSPSSYAADWERLQLKPGKYPLRMTFEQGYLVPMPYWLLCKIDAVRVAGETYSGFGGVNFASKDLPREDATYYVQAYTYQLEGMLKSGTVELLPETEELVTRLCDRSDSWLETIKTLTWERVKELAAQNSQ